MFKYDKRNDTSYCLGSQLTFELLLRRPHLAKRIYISPKQNRDETYQKAIALCRQNNIEVIENNERIFRDLSDKDNVMLIGEFLKEENSLESNANQIVLVNPSNMGNLGTIIRTAAAFNILDIALIEPCPDYFDPKVIRASMGAFFSIRIRKYASFETYKSENPNHHFYPFMLKAKCSLQDAKKEYPFALIFGNEATGLADSYLEEGTPLVIPNSSLVDSLNLDNAVSIAVYEFTK